MKFQTTILATLLALGWAVIPVSAHHTQPAPTKSGEPSQPPDSSVGDDPAQTTARPASPEEPKTTGKAKSKAKKARQKKSVSQRDAHKKAVQAPTLKETSRSTRRDAQSSHRFQSRQAALEEAIENFRRHGTAPIVWRPDGTVFPFGQSQPIVTCTPLRACDIELEEGEVVRDVALGDSERWIASPLKSGTVNATVPHVVVKPKDYGLTTNLVIGTTRRTYHLALVSPREAEDTQSTGFDHYISFYYPEDLVDSWTKDEELARATTEQRAQTPTAAESASSPRLKDLNFSYKLRANRSISWAPETIFDDGKQVYIRLPETVRASDLPALLIDVGGGLGLSNYRVDGLWYIVDGLFERAELVIGVGKRRQKVSIRNLAFARG